MGNSGTENREAALPLGLQEMTQGRRGDLGEVQTVLESEAAAHRMVEFLGHRQMEPEHRRPISRVPGKLTGESTRG